MKIKLIKFRDDLIKPTRAHYNDAGIDCYAQETVTLKALDAYPVMGGEVEKERNFLFTMPLPQIPTDPYSLSITTTSALSAVPTRVDLGFGIEVPDGYMAVVKPRSSMNLRGIITQIGTIDSGYRGEIGGVFINLTNKDIVINKGEKICQLVIEPVVLADLEEELVNDRGTGGFGSTGK